jgi:SAM-dependent methyltransferase
MYLNSYLLLKKHLLPLTKGRISLLEVGAGKRFHDSVLYCHSREQRWNYYHCDLVDYPNSRGTPGYIRMSGENTIDAPFSFDLVGCTQVIEHVRRPWLWVAELARVCNLGGLVVIVGPATWCLHRNPYDCWRILPDGMRVLMEDAGLKVLVNSLECLDKTTDEGRHHLNQAPAAHWDVIAIGRKSNAA